MIQKICFDNGHGSNTPGKCSPDGGKSHREYKWARIVVRKAVDKLRRLNYDAINICPEETDTSLAIRCNRVEQWCAKFGKANVLLVSVHNNAAGADGRWHNARGWCAFTTKGKTKADELASCLYDVAQDKLKAYASTFSPEEIASKQRPIRTDYTDGDADLEENFYILRHTSCPSVLVEHMFQDNLKDVAWLSVEANQNLCADILVEGVIKFINQNR